MSFVDSAARASGLRATTLYLQALHQPKLFDPDFVGRLIEDHEKLRAKRPISPPSSDYQVRYLRRVASRYLEYLKWHYETLKVSK